MHSENPSSFMYLAIAMAGRLLSQSYYLSEISLQRLNERLYFGFTPLNVKVPSLARDERS